MKASKSIKKPSKTQEKHIEKPFVDKSAAKGEKMGKIMNTDVKLKHPRGGRVKEFDEKLPGKKVSKKRK